jgi:riboflavin kinase/FMN adenylyltransferase
VELIRGLHNLRSRHRGCVLTIGNYDGMHLGHRAVIADLRSRAEYRGLPVTVMVFEPTPKEFFAPGEAPARLSSLREKLEAMQACGVDRVLCLGFDRRLADMPPADFIQRILVDGLGTHFVAVGDDFRFGKNKAGDFAMLERAGREAGFAVHRHESVERDGGRVSSTRVREALAAGDTALAGRLLGKPYHMSGRVAPGERLGRTLGFPTANLRVHRIPAPRWGVYVVSVRGADPDRAVPGVVSLGVRPTVGGKDCLLEAHLLGFDREIYGRRLKVDFLHFLRDEARFSSVEAMRGQMEQDLVQTRAYFNSGQPDTTT